jgi:hypothetical protein
LLHDTAVNFKPKAGFSQRGLSQFISTAGLALSKNLRNLFDTRLETWKAKNQVQRHQQSNEAEGGKDDQVPIGHRGMEPTACEIFAGAECGVGRAPRAAA